VFGRAWSAGVVAAHQIRRQPLRPGSRGFVLHQLVSAPVSRLTLAVAVSRSAWRRAAWRVR